jgi:hypothetical protein
MDTGAPTDRGELTCQRQDRKEARVAREKVQGELFFPNLIPSSYTSGHELRRRKGLEHFAPISTPSRSRPPRMRSPRPATTSLPSTRAAAFIVVLHHVAL